MFDFIHSQYHHYQEQLRRLVPTPCIACGVSCNQSISLCDFCRLELPWIKDACYSCGLPLPATALDARRCGKCLSHELPFNFCKGVFNYSSPLNKLIPRFKFHHQTDIGFTLASLLARQFAEEYRDIPKPQLLLPVPLHSQRFRSRGFNQALLIAKVISKHTAIPIGNNAVRKVKNTLPQTRMTNAKLRQKNQNKVFFLDKKRLPKNVNHIAIIDDVVTTMATVMSLSKVLRSHGIRHIDVWCLARASV